MTTHTVGTRYIPTTPKQGAATLRHPALATAAAIVGCVLVAVLVGLALIALTSGGPPVTVHHQIGHGAIVVASATTTTVHAAPQSKVAAANDGGVRAWRGTLHGRTLGAGRIPAAALLRAASVG
jgi:hypothetical protein